MLPKPFDFWIDSFKGIKEEGEKDIQKAKDRKKTARGK